MNDMTFLSPRGGVRLCGKFFHAGAGRFLVKGVAYGTFRPNAGGYQFPSLARSLEDFRMMRAFGINTVRTYTVPRMELLDLAADHGLKVIVGIPWTQHTAFLADNRNARTIRGEVAGHVRALAGHPAVLLFALGNEIPPAIVRWHGATKVERFLADLYGEAKGIAPASVFTYVNFPPTEFLDLSFLDVCAFNVYLHREADLRAYLARLQNIAGDKPLLLTEAGADAFREGPDGQTSLTTMQLRAAFTEGACGAVVFSWTDEWWRGGHDVVDWSFGLVDADRRPKPALDAVARVFAEAPFSESDQAWWPKVSVVVCAYNAADTIDECLTSLEQLTYPNFEILVINDGSRDRTSAIAKSHPRAIVVDTPNRGLAAARNVGLERATGEIIAYTDSDVRVDPDWLTYLVQPLLTSEYVAAGGLSLPPPEDPWIAQCVARAPGSPTHVLLDDRTAEHVPGCNMAYVTSALRSIGGFNPIFLRAGDDVDVCWRVQDRGWKIGFAPSAVVWHHHRHSIRAYWRQQVGYGEGETWLQPHHPDKLQNGRAKWKGHIYSPLPFVRAMSQTRVKAGVWGTAPFPSVYRVSAGAVEFIPHLVRWQIASALFVAIGVIGWVATPRYHLTIALVALLGAIGLAATAFKCLRYGWRTNIERLPAVSRHVLLNRLAYGLVIAWLHFLQPLARAWGRIRGVLSPPKVPVPLAAAGQGRAERRRRLSRRELIWVLRLFTGRSLDGAYWSEQWVDRTQLLSTITDGLWKAGASQRIEPDDGWQLVRDISIGCGRWGRFDVRTLIEEHESSKCLLRVSTNFQVTPLGATLVVIGAAALAVPIAAFGAVGAAASAPAAMALVCRLAQQAGRTLRVAKRSVETAIVDAGFQRLPPTQATQTAPRSQAPVVIPSIESPAIEFAAVRPAAPPRPVHAPDLRDGAVRAFSLVFDPSISRDDAAPETGMRVPTLPSLAASGRPRPVHVKPRRVTTNARGTEAR